MNDLQEEPRQLGEELAELRQTATELRKRIAERADGAIDDAERSALITAAEEQEAFIAALQERRDKLVERLGGQELQER